MAFSLTGAESVAGWFGRNWMPWGLVIVGSIVIAVKSAIMGAAKRPGGKNGHA